MKFLILLLVISYPVISLGQAGSFTADARIDRTSDGNLYITANSPRPLWQTIEGLRLRYGWTVDYVDPIYPSQLFMWSPDKHPYPAGGEFRSNTMEPANSSPSEEQRVLKDIVQQYNAQSPMKFRVVKLSDVRYEVVPKTDSLLDLPVQIDATTRSLRAEIDAIAAALTKASGIKVVQGGLVDTNMEDKTVSLHHDGPISARSLINEVLNHDPDRKVVTVSYDPNGSFFAIGIQSTEQWIPGEDGNTTVKKFANPDFIAQGR